MDLTDFPPGRELDALIAERVFGWIGCDPTVKWGKWKYGDPGDMWTEIEEPWCRGHGRPPWSGNLEPYPRYSEDIAAAWEVVEKLTTTTKQWFHLEQHSVGCAVSFATVGAGDRDFEVKAEAETAAHAICLAALEAARQHPLSAPE